MKERITIDRHMSPLELLKTQRSHKLFVLSNAKCGQEDTFHSWYMGDYLKAILVNRQVVEVQLYEQHEVDITQGKCSRLPYQYLSIIDLSLDGAQEADELIKAIQVSHESQEGAEIPATWLYYPVSERVGKHAKQKSKLLTIAFANGMPGKELEFREWYATRHIRHALNISALVSGQCFQRTEFQVSGALNVLYDTIAIYEQEGEPMAIIDAFESLPKGTLSFPSLDTNFGRFAESVYISIEVTENGAYY